MFLVIFVFAFIATASIMDNSVAADPPAARNICPCHWRSFKGGCYFLSQGAGNWYSARAACRIRGGDLAVPTNHAIDCFIRNLLRARKIRAAYIGLYRVDKNLGKNTFYTVFGERPIFTKWHRGEPNNWGSGEACTEILKHHGWNDISCHRRLHYVCQLRPRFQRC